MLKAKDAKINTKVTRLTEERSKMESKPYHHKVM
jgi:hypothetical protein